MTDTVVVGVDDSVGARAALAWAARHSLSEGRRLRVVHAYELNLAWIDEYNAAIPQWKQHARDVAEETLSRVANDVLEGSQLDAVQLEAIAGSPAEVLHDAARHAALLVVGSRGRGGFAGLLLGSVSQRLAQRAPCPVVIVPSPHDGPEVAVSSRSPVS